MEIEVQSSQKEELLPHYVYVLALPNESSPDQERVFYVGKGQGARMEHHWAEVRSEYVNSANFVPTAKQIRLLEIKKSDQEPLQRIIGRFKTAEEAFAVEATLIKWVYGFQNLTNTVQGHGTKFIRECGTWEKMAHLEVPKPIGINDGTYSKGKKEDLTEAGAYEFFDDLLEELRAADFITRGFEEKADRPYDPGESNGVLGAIVRIQGVDFLICLRKTIKMKIYVATTQSTREANSLIERTGWHLGAPKNSVVNGVPRYREFDDRNVKAEFSEIADFMAGMQKLRGDLKSVEPA